MNRFPLFPDGPYGYQQNFSATHRGIDIMAPLGTPVLAVDDGIAWTQLDPKGGKVVYLQDNGSFTRGTQSIYYYAHLSDWFPMLEHAKQQADAIEVRAGDVLGFVGTTGNAAGRPPHLHFQIRRGSLVIDPFDDLQAVDPHPERGAAGQTVDTPRGGFALPSMLPNIKGPLALLALLWLFTQQGRR